MGNFCSFFPFCLKFPFLQKPSLMPQSWISYFFMCSPRYSLYRSRKTNKRKKKLPFGIKCSRDVLRFGNVWCILLADKINDISLDGKHTWWNVSWGRWYASEMLTTFPGTLHVAFCTSMLSQVCLAQGNDFPAERACNARGNCSVACKSLIFCNMPTTFLLQILLLLFLNIWITRGMALESGRKIKKIF